MTEHKGILKYGLSLHMVIIILFIVGTLLSALVVNSSFQMTDQFGVATQASSDYLTCQDNVYAVRDTIHELNEYARDFVVSGNTEQVMQYFNEVQVRRTMETSLEALKGYLVEDRTLKQLETAIELNARMSDIQWYAMRLAIEAYGYDLNRYPAPLKTVELSAEDLALTGEAQRNRALDMLFSKEYILLRNQVDLRINLCKNTLAESMTARQQESSEAMRGVLIRQRQLLTWMVALLIGLLVFVLVLVVHPINRLIRSIRGMESVKPQGSRELRFLAETYNHMQDRMKEANANLDYKATHDALTGLYNRSAYEGLWTNRRGENIALLIVDVDLFKEINDNFGHDTGDRVLVRVAKVLLDTFREADKVCRIGGDEFSVIMVGVTSSVTEVIRRKIKNAAGVLATPEEGMPGITISVGCAFSDRLKAGESLFKNADRALYHIKENGRNGCGFYGEDDDRPIGGKGEE